MSGITVEQIREARHFLEHDLDGQLYITQDGFVFSPYDEQPPCNICGKARGTPIPDEALNEAS